MSSHISVVSRDLVVIGCAFYAALIPILLAATVRVELLYRKRRHECYQGAVRLRSIFMATLLAFAVVRLVQLFFTLKLVDDITDINSITGAQTTQIIFAMFAIGYILIFTTKWAMVWVWAWSAREQHSQKMKNYLVGCALTGIPLCVGIAVMFVLMILRTGVAFGANGQKWNDAKLNEWGEITDYYLSAVSLLVAASIIVIGTRMVLQLFAAAERAEKGPHWQWKWVKLQCRSDGGLALCAAASFIFRAVENAALAYSPSLQDVSATKGSEILFAGWIITEIIPVAAMGLLILWQVSHGQSTPLPAWSLEYGDGLAVPPISEARLTVDIL